MEPGSIVSFHGNDGRVIGTGSFNPHTLIAGRVFTRSPLDEINAEWFERKLKIALARREALILSPYYRLVHAEADDLPGVIIDRFGEHFCVQINTAGMEKLWPDLLAALNSLFNPQSIILHNDSSIRTLEGLNKYTKVVKGEMSSAVEVYENDLTYFTDLVQGQKTGWYYDQRDNHALIAGMAKGKSVLDLYSHAGGFSLLAAKNGASKVIGVDSSALALELAMKAAEHNKLQKICSWVRADVFDDLEERIVAKERFDIVIADPPPFVKSRKDLAAGARGYRKLAARSGVLVAPQGLLYIASCSHNMDLATFTAEVARGLGEAKRSGQILYTTFAAPDHPVHPHLPESSYLKGLLLRLD